jgi:general secretion pathway protein B
MSFILDALKKSETDRQQQSGAEFTGVPTSPQSPTVPRWLWIVGLLLAVNLVVLIGLLLKPDQAEPVQASTLIDSTAHQQPTDNAPQPSFKEQVAVARESPPSQQSELGAVEAEEQTETTVRSVLISQNPSAVPASSLYPTLQEVRARGTINLPDLHLDIHVFSPDPGDRFAFINMSKLREGATLSEGPVVIEITSDGVVLQHEGQMFLLPRE